jgi:hypothetical protein
MKAGLDKSAGSLHGHFAISLLREPLNDEGGMAGKSEPPLSDLHGIAGT